MKWSLGRGIGLVARCEYDAIMPTQQGKVFINIKALNEWDSKVLLYQSFSLSVCQSITWEVSGSLFTRAKPFFFSAKLQLDASSSDTASKGASSRLKEALL